MKTTFDHEKLDVYQESIRVVCWADELLRDIPKTLAVHNQLDRASTEFPLTLQRVMANTQIRIESMSSLSIMAHTPLEQPITIRITIRIRSNSDGVVLRPRLVSYASLS